MLFKELTVSQKFRIVSGDLSGQYIRLKDYAGNCCNKPYNCARLSEDLTKETKRLKLDENLEVELI